MRRGAATALAVALLLGAACDTDEAAALSDGAADAAAQDAGGDVALDAATPAPGCAAAKPLTLVAGRASVAGSTTGGTNEFGQTVTCGGPAGLTGPQVYYRVQLSAAKDYVIALKPAYSRAALYVFGGVCTAAAVDAACGSKGKTGAVSLGTTAGDRVELLFSPTASGQYTVAVDGRGAGNYGAFELSVEEYPLPGNWSCKKPAAFSLSGGKALIKGTTLGGANEFGAQINCGGAKALAGPQAYYRGALVSGEVYRLTLTPTFPAQLYVFSGGCSPAQIQSACASKGATGDALQVYATASTSLYYRAAGDTTVVVDSVSPTYHGAFVLDVARTTAPTNGRCAGAATLSLSKGAVTVQGDTTAAPNQFGAAVTCGVQAMVGHQVYYTVNLKAGTTTTFSTTAGFDSARLYVFGAACSSAAVDAACKSKGQAGLVSPLMHKGKATVVTFTPQKTGSYTVALDSVSANARGTFSLTIK